MYARKVGKAVKPRLKNVIVPRLNLAALRPQVGTAITRLHSTNTSSSAEAVNSSESFSRSEAEEAASPRAPQEHYKVNSESLTGSQGRKHKQEPQREELHYPHVFRKEFYEHADQASTKVPAINDVPKSDSAFNYPHIFRKEFYEHADQVPQSPGLPTSQQQRLRAQEERVAAEQHEEEQVASPPKRCQVHGLPVREDYNLPEKVCTPSQHLRSAPELEQSGEVATTREDESAGGIGRLKSPCFGLGYSSRLPSPHTAAAALKKAAHLSPQSSHGRPASPQPPQTTSLHKQDASFAPKITSVFTPCPHGATNKRPDGALKLQDQTTRHRRYFNSIVRDHPREQLRSEIPAANPESQIFKEKLIAKSHATASTSGSSSSTSIGDVHHECICSKASTTPPGSNLSYRSWDRKEYDPYARMWEREVPPSAPLIPEPSTSERHLPRSIVRKCNMEAYNKYYIEGRKKDGSRQCQMEGPPCPYNEYDVTSSELDEQMRSLFHKTSEHLPAVSPEWPTVARARGSQFSTALEDARHDKHYVSSGRFDVLPVVATHLGSTNPPVTMMRSKGEGAGKLRCPTCGADVCKDCSSALERWPAATESAIAAQYLDKILKTETEQFNPRAALEKLAKKKGVTVDRLVDLRSGSGRGARSGKCHPRFQQLCEIQDPCCFRVVPRKVGKQVDEKWLALKRRRPNLNDLWVQSDRCPQVCATAPMSSRPRPVSPVPWDKAKEASLIWDQRISSCRAAFCTMAVYDSYRV